MLKVPKKLVDQEREPFPPGIFDGELVKFELRKEVSEETGEITRAALRPSFVNLTPVDEKTPHPGNRPFTGFGAEIPIVHDGISLLEIEENGGIVDWDSLPYSLQRGATLLTQAALAFGWAKRDEAGNALVPFKEFLEVALAEDSPFNGRKLRIRVTNRTPSKRADGSAIPPAERRTYDQLETIAPSA